MKALVKFYGIKCIAKIRETDFELIGKNEFTQLLLDIYMLIIWLIIHFSNLFLVKKIPCLKLGIIEEIEEN